MKKSMNELTISESSVSCSRQRTKSESYVYSKIIRRSNQQFSSIENLESLITCSIHLGLIEEPRQLPCGHAFCYSCLKNYLNHYSSPKKRFLICPLCRYETSIDSRTLDVLAPSVVHKQLTEYLILKRERVVDHSVELENISSEIDFNQNEIKLELMRHLMKDFKKEISINSKSDLDKQLNSIFDEHKISSTKKNSRIRSLSESGYKESLKEFRNQSFDFYKEFDQSSIRKNMRKYREYKLIKSVIHPKQSEILHVSWMDLSEPVECLVDSEVIIYIIKNSSFIYFSNLNGTKLRNFDLKVDGHILNPFFVKCQGEVLFVIGNSDKESVLMKVSLNGEVLKLSNRYPGSFGGFCFDSLNDSILVAYPSQHSVVAIERTSLKEIRMYNFGDLSPMYVTKSSNCREIWVSCPENGRIAVYDEVEDNYLHLDTSQIYESLPTHINETNDHRILFLDSSWSRIFWIRRWNNELYIQLLIVFGVNEEMEINSVEPLSDNMIMISNNHSTYIAKPSRSVKEEHRKEKCILL